MLDVVLLEYTRGAQEVIAAAAKLCYYDKSVSELKGEFTKQKASKFTKMLREIGHESPMEHASFTFGIDGVSRACMAQITRHRIASFNVQSQRYVNKSAFKFVIPPAIEKDKEAKALFIEAMTEANTKYLKLAEILKQQYIKKMKTDGVLEAEASSKAEKLAIEDARYVLPNACETRMIVTMNARELLHFFELRCCNRAQWEVRGVAFAMLRHVKVVAPELFEKAGPNCLRGACKEGKMSCGKAEEIKKIYSF